MIGFWSTLRLNSILFTFHSAGERQKHISSLAAWMHQLAHIITLVQNTIVLMWPSPIVSRYYCRIIKVHFWSRWLMEDTVNVNLYKYKTHNKLHRQIFPCQCGQFNRFIDPTVLHIIILLRPSQRILREPWLTVWAVQPTVSSWIIYSW